MENIDQPKQLTIIKTDVTGHLSYEHYARDENGNIWRGKEFNGHVGDWAFYKKASEIQPPPLSFQQILELNSQEKA